MRYLLGWMMVLTVLACESEQLKMERAIVDCYNQASENPWNESWRLQAGYKAIPRFLLQNKLIGSTNFEDYRQLIKDLIEERADFPFDDYYIGVAARFPEIDRPSVMASLILCPSTVSDLSVASEDSFFKDWKEQLNSMEDIGELQLVEVLKLMDIAGPIHFRKEAFRMPVVILLHHYLSRQVSEVVKRTNVKPIKSQE